ncbi:MAG: penicillin-binding protein 2 [Parcubacteria group bacterium]|nr:penicillin-binding protein 2 [Parcubacteria group bacterium]
MSRKKYFIKNKVKENVEAEEIFLDAEAIRSLEEKGKLEKPIKRRNFILFYIVIIFGLLILLSRAGYLQIIKGEYYQNLAQGNKLRIYSIFAPRGIIYDYSGKALVRNIPRFDLVVNLVDFLDNSDLIQEEILERIINIVNQQDLGTKEELKQEIEEAHSQMSQLVLIKGVERTAALILESLIDDWPGLRIEKNAQREYIFTPYSSHILGYTGQVDPDDLDNYPDYSSNDQIGKTGLERQYDSFLRGELGQDQIEVDHLGKTQKLLVSKSAQPGQGLLLFVNQDLQEKLYQALNKILDKLFYEDKSKKAVGLVIDPNNGGVLALVSLPDFDNNLFAQGISQENLNFLENSLSYPFLNRALAGQYPSGSIIKPLIAAAALEEKIISPNRQINCQGAINIVNKYNPQIVYNFPDWKTHGLTDMIKAIAESCNIYFYTISGGHGGIDGLGDEKIKEYLQYFGLGQATQIDLPHEEIGLIPDRNWKEENKPDEEWYLGDTYHLAIGQGDVLVTPLQMAMAIASIANNGILYKPQIVDKIIDLDKNVLEDMPTQVIKENFIQLQNIKVVQEGMRQAVLSGSARSLSDLSVEVAGKTGTAQFGTKGETHAWFVGFAPYDNPEIVLVILIEGGGGGDESAVPVAKEVFKWYFR